MSSPTDTDPTATALHVLADPRRRYLLAALLDREDTSPTAAPSPNAGLPLADVATEVAAAEHCSPIVPDELCREIRISLHHVHVPLLVDVGVLDRSTGGDATTVALADHPVLAADWVGTLLAEPTGETFPAPESTLDRTLEVLRDPRRRTVCTVLANRRGSVPVDDLAAAVVAQEAGDGASLADGTESARSVATALVHEHLPALADAGLVTSDDAADRAALDTDAPQWQTDWIAGPLPEATAHVRGESDRQKRLKSAQSMTTDGPTDRSEPDDCESGDAAVESCWTIQGRTNVFARGHEIADGAEEELFVMAPSTDTIRSTCLERWRNAADRGVDVYVASRSPRVRDTVRSAVPAATICDPQFDWLTFPMETTRHGYVILADRESAMVVTVETPVSGDATPRVGAISGDGRGNALVSLVRDQLGPRLDRLTDTSARRDGTPLPM